MNAYNFSLQVYPCGILCASFPGRSRQIGISTFSRRSPGQLRRSRLATTRTHKEIFQNDCGFKDHGIDH